MKQQQHQSLTPKLISDYQSMNEEFIEKGTEFRIHLPIQKPNPPTADAIKRAQFVDKTYQWTNARIRSRD